MRFDDLAEINPSVPIRKGDIRPFIDMSALPQHARDVSEVGERGFKGSGSRFKNGDTLIARITPCLENGKGALIHSLPEGVPGFGSTEFIVARARSENDTRFIYYLTRSEVFREIAISRMEGTSGRQRVSWQQIASIEIPDLRPDERKEIGDILGLLDDKIELNRRIAATLEEMARALYRSWFVDFDPVKAKAEGRAPAFMDEATAALFPDRFGDDGLPEGWKTQFLLDQSLWVNGAAYKDMHFSDAPDALPVIKIAELKAGITGNTKFTATDLGEKFRITRGELLFSWSGNPDTSIDAFIWSLGEAWLNQHIFAVRPNGRMSKAMLFTCLRFFKPEMAEIARNKQTTGLGHITRKDLEAFPVSVAPRPVMSAFDERLFPIFDRYCECLFETQTLKELRDTLLPKLMSGELRVGEARDQIEEVA
jgi:type I restriction enzyme S subunit